MAQSYDYPPNKRMRFDEAASPHAMSPYASTPSPVTPQIQLPTSHGPFNFNTPQLIQRPGGQPLGEIGPPVGTPGGVMGPPQRPAERAAEKQGRDQGVDMNSLTDVMFGTDVNLKDEEAAMQASYRDSQSQSFGTQSTATLTPSNSFGASQSFSFPSSGLASQQPLSQQAIDDEITAQNKASARAYAERKQAPLYDPFLQMNSLRIKLQHIAQDNGVRTDLNGVYYKNEQRSDPTGVAGVGPDGVGVVAASQASSSWVEANAQLTDLLAILSLAANERLRGITEDAYALARGRQASSHGVVDPDWTSIANGQGNGEPTSAVPLSLTGTAWDKLPESSGSPTTDPAKQPLDDREKKANRLPTPPTEPPPTPKPTVSYGNTLVPALRSLARKEREAEQARILARQKRQNVAKGGTPATAPDAGVNGVDPATSTPATPGTPANTVAPELGKAMTKKEAAKQNKAQSETMLFSSSNDVAAMALGGGRKFSWMSKPAAVKQPPAVAKLGAPVGGAGAASTGGGTPARPADGPAVDQGLRAKDRKLGTWREDGKFGKGIQIRDLAYVLEGDGKAKRALARLLVKLNSKDEMDSREYWHT